MKKGLIRKLVCVTFLSLGICAGTCGCGQMDAQEAQTEQEDIEEIAEEDSTSEHNDTEDGITANAFEQVLQKENPVEQGSGNDSEEQKTATVEETLDQGDHEKTSEEEKDSLENEVDWTKVNTFEKPVTLYAQSIVNVRKGPDTSFEVLGRLATNDQVEVFGEYTEGKWMAVTFQGEKAFVSGRYLGEEQLDLAALQAEQETAALAAVEADRQKMEEAEKVASEQAAIEENPAPPYIASPAGVVFVGDSRCVQMSAAVGGGGSTWICENSKRYSWFEANAVPRLDNIVGKGTKVVICMGVNDPWDYNQYAALANQRAAEWAARGATTYFVSVNPVWENPYVTQEQVDTFNANMPGLLNGVRWIDTASIVKQGGYKLVDGLHYDTSAYINIFNLICGSL